MASAYTKLAAAVFLFLLSALPSLASTPQPPAIPRDYVTDLAGVVKTEVRTRLNEHLQNLERSTTAQVIVLTVQSLDGQDIKEFGVEIFKGWKLGQKGKDNGVLILVAVKDKKYHFEVGYGLEGVLPDSMVGSIGREYFVPFFRQGDFSAGIYAGTLIVAKTIAGNDSSQLGKGDAAGQHQGILQQPLRFVQKVFFGLVLAAAFILFITHPRQCFLVLLAMNMGGGRGGWSGGSGGFGGGSFGGGGGGSSGGGGASGSW